METSKTAAAPEAAASAPDAAAPAAEGDAAAPAAAEPAAAAAPAAAAEPAAAAAGKNYDIPRNSIVSVKLEAGKDGLGFPAVREAFGGRDAGIRHVDFKMVNAPPALTPGPRLQIPDPACQTRSAPSPPTSPQPTANATASAVHKAVVKQSMNSNRSQFKALTSRARHPAFHDGFATSTTI